MVGLEKGARGLLLAASVLAASGVSARADDTAPPPPDIVGDIVQMFSWIDDRLTEAIRTGQPETAPASEPAPARAEPEPGAKSSPVAAAPPEPVPADAENPLRDLVNWLDSQLEAGARYSQPTSDSPSLPEAAPPVAAASAPTPAPVPAEPVLTAEPLDLTGKATPPAKAGERGGLLVR